MEKKKTNIKAKETKSKTPSDKKKIDAKKTSNGKKAPNGNKYVTMDLLIIIVIISAILITLVGFVTYNFGLSHGEADKVQSEEDIINQEMIEMAETQDAMKAKYADVYDIVTDGTYHESEDQYDLSVFKKDYPLIDYSGVPGWQLIIRNNNGNAYVCADNSILNKYSDCLYTYITPYNTEDSDPANSISIIVDGEIAKIILCERIYFTSQELRDSFVQANPTN